MIHVDTLLGNQVRDAICVTMQGTELQGGKSALEDCRVHIELVLMSLEELFQLVRFASKTQNALKLLLRRQQKLGEQATHEGSPLVCTPSTPWRLGLFLVPALVLARRGASPTKVDIKEERVPALPGDFELDKERLHARPAPQRRARKRKKVALK